MTREETIELKAAVGRLMYSDNKDIRDYNALIDFIESALRRAGREQVEQVWRGCEYCSDDCPPLDWQFGLDHILPNYKYCPMCGAKMDGEAADYDGAGIQMQRR